MPVVDSSKISDLWSSSSATRSGGIVVVILTACLLAAGLATSTAAPADATETVQTQQTDWYFNDNPTLFGPQQAWYTGDSGQGYGSNNYRWTYAIGGESSADNWVHWYMGDRIGRQAISAYIPATKATATVTYEIYVDNVFKYSKRIHQQQYSGWVHLGTWNFNGADVLIAVLDNKAVEHYNTNGRALSRIGIDAMAMRCVENCGSSTTTTSTTTTTTTSTTTTVSTTTEQTDWFTNDNPTLFGPQRSWYQGDQGSGYGSNNYRYTYATGGETSADNWVHWYMGDRVGRQTVRAYVPATKATATVVYKIYVDNVFRYSKRIDQQQYSGWTTLGTWDFNGADVLVFVADNEAAENYSTDGLALSRIGIDAIQMRCVADCQVAGTDPPSRPRNVNAVPHGKNQIRVTWSSPSDPGSSALKHYRVEFARPAIGNIPAWSGAEIVTGTSATSGQLRYGVTYTVSVTATNQDGRTGSPRRVTATTNTKVITSPDPVQSVNAVAHGTNQIKVTWTPPSNSGSSSIKHYTVQYSRPANGDSPAWSSDPVRVTGTSTTSGDLRYGVTYTATVTATNQDGRTSSPRRDTATTNTKVITGPEPPRRVTAVAHGTNQIRVTWSPPSDPGSSSIKHYTVEYSRPVVGTPVWTSGPITVTGTSHTSGSRRQGVAYKVTVAATNEDGRTSRSASDNVTTNSPVITRPDSPRRVDAVLQGTNEIRVTWSPPRDTGSSPIKYYTVQYSRPAIGDSSAWTSRPVKVTGTSHTSGRLRRDATYRVTVSATNEDRQTSRAASDNVTTNRPTTTSPPTGKPKITGLNEIHGSNFFTNNENDVEVFWDSTTVNNATGYYIERRYVRYPTKQVNIGGRTLDLPDLAANPNVVVESSRKTGSLSNEFQFPNASEEKYRDQHWTLQFRVIPYNAAGPGRHPSDWVSLGTAVLASAFRNIGSCQTLDSVYKTYSLADTAWSAITIAAIAMTGGQATLAVYIAKLVLGNRIQNSIYSTIEGIAGCYEGTGVDLLGDLIPGLDWFMDATGISRVLRSIECRYNPDFLQDVHDAFASGQNGEDVLRRCIG